MKKRSLFAAVAMLIVSAVVLTSATYAWFASNTRADVGTISSSVATSDGSIMVSPYNHASKGWTNTLTQELIEATTNGTDGALHYFTSSLAPVTFDGTNFKKYSMSGLNIEGTGSVPTESNNYVSFKFYIKASIDTNVTVASTLANNAGFVYGYVKVDTNTAQLLGTASSAYYPLTNTNGYAVDNNNNFIVDDSNHYPLTPPQGFTYDTLGKDAVPDDPDVEGDQSEAAKPAPSFGSLQTATGLTGSTTFAATHDVIYPVTVYIWAEGQDPDCTGTTAATPTLDIAVTKAAQQGGQG